MKFRFTNPELFWLHDKVNKLLYVAQKRGDEAYVRIAAKMRYKFGPNAVYVCLTKRERVCLLSLINSRLEIIEKPGDAEMLTMRDITKKLVGGSDLDANQTDTCES